MQSQNRIFEDLSKVATSAMGTMAGVGREVETMVRGRIKDAVGGLDMVGRDEFEAVKAMAATARADAEKLRAEITELRAMMASAAAPSPAPEAGGSAPIV
jgi:BMFP domain-containing protein YqiC